MSEVQGFIPIPPEDQNQRIVELTQAMLRQELYGSAYNMVSYLELMHAEFSDIAREKVDAIRQDALELRSQIYEAMDRQQFSELITEDRDLSPRRKLTHLLNRMKELHRETSTDELEWRNDLKQAMNAGQHLLRWLDQLYQGVQAIETGSNAWVATQIPGLIQETYHSPGMTNFTQVVERRAEYYAGLNMSGRLLVVDDDEVSRSVLVQTLVRIGFMTDEAGDGAQALSMLRRESYDLVLLDTTMPKINGLQVIRWIHEQEELSAIPVLMMSTMQQIDLVAQCLLLGADDFMIKPINDVLLLSRIVGCLDKYAAFLELKRSREKLVAQLAQAGQYVRTVLPSPIKKGPLKVDWVFEPSQMLGGDIFGYHWLKKRQLALYLLDVSGHGVEAAMLAETAIHFLRAKLLNKTNYDQPKKVLRGMNQIFDSEQHAGNYFTLWYGVIDLKEKVLRYASAGHPPALMIREKHHKTKIKELITIQPPIGLVEDYKYQEDEEKLPDDFQLLLFSDGLYELESEFGGYQSLDTFLDRVKHDLAEHSPQALVQDARAYLKGKSFEDDVSVISVRGIDDEDHDECDDFEESGII